MSTFKAHSLKRTFSPLKIGHPKRKVVFQPSIFRCELLVHQSVAQKYVGESWPFTTLGLPEILFITLLQICCFLSHQVQMQPCLMHATLFRERFASRLLEDVVNLRGLLLSRLTAIHFVTFGPQWRSHRNNPQICEGWSTPWITGSPLVRNPYNLGTVYNKQPLQYKVDDHPQENNGNLDFRPQHIWFFCLHLFGTFWICQKPSPCLRHDGIRSLQLLDRRTANSQKNAGVLQRKKSWRYFCEGFLNLDAKIIQNSSNHTESDLLKEGENENVCSWNQSGVIILPTKQCSTVGGNPSKFPYIWIVCNDPQKNKNLVIQWPLFLTTFIKPSQEKPREFCSWNKYPTSQDSCRSRWQHTMTSADQKPWSLLFTVPVFFLKWPLYDYKYI